MGEIVGGVIGGLIFLILISVILVIIHRRRSMKRVQSVGTGMVTLDRSELSEPSDRSQVVEQLSGRLDPLPKFEQPSGRLHEPPSDIASGRLRGGYDQ